FRLFFQQGLRPLFACFCCNPRFRSCWFPSIVCLDIRPFGKFCSGNGLGRGRAPPSGEFAIRARRRAAGGSERKAGGKTQAQRIQASSEQLSARLPDYAARERSARFIGCGGGVIHGNGRSLWPSLLPVSGGFLPVSVARVSDEPFCAGCVFALGE